MRETASANRTAGRPEERHPRHPGARVVRSLRGLRGVRGWGRIANLFVPPDAEGAFAVENPSGWFAGDLASFVDRQMYLYGEYEGELIREFLSIVPPERRSVILDIGANVGTHSLAFACHFASVHSFEPNPALWESFEQNMRINGRTNVAIHQVALADRDSEMPFYSIPKKNFGLGTLSPTSQYDLPLQEIGKVKVAHASRYLETLGLGRVDAIKIDVQGFEREVVRGLAPLLERDEPIVWVEVSTATLADAQTEDAIRALFPFESELFWFEARRSPLCRTVQLVSAPRGRLASGDYVVVPRRLRRFA
jgi:FkbM family methyltransferase